MANRKPHQSDLDQNVTLRMTGSMRAKLRRVADQEDRSEASAIRLAVAQWLLTKHIDSEMEAA